MIIFQTNVFISAWTVNTSTSWEKIFSRGKMESTWISSILKSRWRYHCFKERANSLDNKWYNTKIMNTIVALVLEFTAMPLGWVRDLCLCKKLEHTSIIHQSSIAAENWCYTHHIMQEWEKNDQCNTMLTLTWSSKNFTYWTASSSIVLISTCQNSDT